MTDTLEITASSSRRTGEAHGWFTYQRAVIANTLLTVAIVLPVLGRNPFWRDEAFSAYIAGSPAGLEASIIRKREAAMGLYYEVLHFWMFLGRSEFALRFLSLISAAAAIPVSMAVARRLFGDRVAAVSGLVLATNTFFLTYAKEARSYAFVILFSSLTALTLLRLIEKHSHRRMAGYVASATLLCYLHPLALLVVVSQAAAAVAMTRDKGTIRKLLPSWIAIVVLSIPIGLYVFVVQSGMTGWVPETSLRGLAGFGSDIAGNVPLAVLYIGLIASLIRFVRRDRATSFVAIWAIVPIVLLVAAGLVKNVFVDRYLAGIAPAIAMLIALAITRITPRILQIVASVVLGVLVVENVADRIWTRAQGEDIPAAVRVVELQGKSTDAIAFAPAYSRVGFDYYVSRIGKIKPADVALAPGGRQQQVGDEFPREISSADLAKALLQHPRLWLVGYGDKVNFVPEPMAALQATWLPQHFAQVKVQQFGDLTLTLYRRT